MTGPLFLDANIVMYAIGRAHPLREPCRGALEMVKGGEIAVVSNTEVLQEILHRYLGLKRPEIAQEVYRAVRTICLEIYPVGLDDMDRAVVLLRKSPALNTRDAIHAATMLDRGVKSVLSTDTHFDLIPGIRRVSPETL